jgi:hypothetical protein
MVKGVSKTIIEVNNTGSKFFEKIVFYVTPEYGTLNAKHLKKAAAEFAYCYNSSANKKPLRKYYKRKKIITYLCIGVAFLGVVAASLIIIL